MSPNPVAPLYLGTHIIVNSDPNEVQFNNSALNSIGYIQYKEEIQLTNKDDTASITSSKDSNNKPVLTLNAGDNDGTIVFNSKVMFNDNLGLESIDGFNKLIFAGGSAIEEAKESNGAAEMGDLEVGAAGNLVLSSGTSKMIKFKNDVSMEGNTLSEVLSLNFKEDISLSDKSQKSTILSDNEGKLIMSSKDVIDFVINNNNKIRFTEQEIKLYNKFKISGIKNGTVNGDAVNFDQLNAETNRATAAELALQTLLGDYINQEEEAREAADLQIVDDLTSEVSRATAKEEELQLKIDILNHNLGEVLKYFWRDQTYNLLEEINISIS